MVELGYPFEVGRVTTPAVDVLDRLVPALEVTVSNAPFGAVVTEALGLSWTRDPFDRIITAQALVERAELLTADETILAHCHAPVWQAPDPGDG
jgi:PIN domain nuclease of toxin-antitoxin system